MKISIIVPIYNCEKWLSECIDSLLCQKSPCELEIILVDDGSIDISGNICDEYAAKNKCIKVIHTRNQGVSCARNVGIENATGEWIIFVDGDDVLKNDAIGILYYKVKFYQYDMVRYGAYFFDDDTIWPSLYSYSNNKLEYLDLVVKREAMLGVWGGIYRRKLFQEYDIYFTPGIRTGEDWIVLFKLLCHSSFFYYEESLYGYRVNQYSVTRKRIDYVRPDALIAFNIIIDYAKYNNIILNSTSICKAKSEIRRRVMKDAILNKSKLIYKETELVLDKYAPQSLWKDLYYSKKFKHKIGFLYYHVLSYIYRLI